MTQFKTILMTAAILAAPSIAFAQIDTGAVTDKLKDKAVGEVMDNLTTDDAVTAGKTLLKGGSKEDAAIAVVKGRAEDKVESMTGTDVDLDDLSKDGMIEAGKDVAMEKAKGSATKYTNGASVGGVSTGGVLDAGKAMAEEKVKNSATSYGDKAAGGLRQLIQNLRRLGLQRLIQNLQQLDLRRLILSLQQPGLQQHTLSLRPQRRLLTAHQVQKMQVTEHA